MFFIPTSVTVQYQEQYTTQEPYQVQVSYIEKEPYTTQEIVTTTDPFQEQVNMNGNVITTNERDVYVKNWLGIDAFDHNDFDFVIQNNELDSGGTFTLKANFIPILNDYINLIPKLVPGLPDIDFDVFTGGTLSGSKYISSQSSETITISAPAGRYKVSEYTLIVPSKTVTKYRQVSSVQTLTKYRDITKYRTEIQYRDVIKTQQAQRDINVFMFQRLLGLY